MPAEQAFVHTWKVGPWTVTLSIPRTVPGAVRHVLAEWQPSMPDRPLTPAEQRQYDEGLQAAFLEAAS